MLTFPMLYVFPPPPILMLVILVVGFVIWAVLRTITDAETWFKDEILDDYRAPAKSSGKPAKEESSVDDVLSED